METLTPTELCAATGISQSYASMILGGTRTPALPLAIKIYRKLGRKLGPIAKASEADIEVLERLQGEAA
jgi:transcriptional regulator with XRE-family HTH domain